MTHATFVRLLGERSKPDRILSATIDADQLEATLTRNGFDTLAAPPRGDKQAAEQSLFLRDNVKTMIDAEQARVGRALSRTEKQAIMDRATIVGAAIFGMGWGITGVCPGPAIAGLGAGSWELGYAIAGIALGALLQGITAKR